MVGEPNYLLISGVDKEIPKGISTKWNASSIIQDSNSGRCVHSYDDKFYPFVSSKDEIFQLVLFNPHSGP